MHSNGHYAVHMSLKVTNFGTNRKPICVFLLINNIQAYIPFRTVPKLLHIVGQRSAVDRVSLFNAFVRGEPLNVRNTKFGDKKLEASLYRMVQNVFFEYLESFRRGAGV